MAVSVENFPIRHLAIPPGQSFGGLGRAEALGVMLTATTESPRDHSAQGSAKRRLFPTIVAGLLGAKFLGITPFDIVPTSKL
jgi:hypothetical protein